jgi:general secretion pathway protein G
VPQDFRIIRRSRSEVNFLATMIVVLLMSALFFTACVDREAVAEAMYKEAMERVDRREYEEAVRLFDRIVREYPGTAAERKASRDVLLYRGLSGAVSNYAVQKARDLMTRTARALETHRMRHGRLPAKLADVLDEPPVDPWGNRLEYATTRGGRSYAVRSFGADGKPGGEGENADIMIRNGAFVTAEGSR